MAPAELVPARMSALLDSGFVHSAARSMRAGRLRRRAEIPAPGRCINFLLALRRAVRKNEEALEMVVVTLREMAKGGMHDQLGGGFHRYSVDEHWFVPHFEKMLYDQAQLAISYLEALSDHATSLSPAVARDIFDYVLRDLTRSGRRLLFGRGCRQRHRSGEPERKGRRRVLHLDAR